eukprot:GHVN01004275.1.p1 GENE.GHVN01004275.1~~GHVN01004275.1.p1  ORF type:complete len:103 (+),score=12.06 GHVN01004275.1:112-420(+)
MLTANGRYNVAKLPSGLDCFVFIGKRDIDGLPEPKLCICDGEKKLTWMNAEEVEELRKLIPRLLSYFELWEIKREKQKPPKDLDPVTFEDPSRKAPTEPYFF